VQDGSAYIPCIQLIPDSSEAQRYDLYLDKTSDTPLQFEVAEGLSNGSEEIFISSDSQEARDLLELQAETFQAESRVADGVSSYISTKGFARKGGATTQHSFEKDDIRNSPLVEGSLEVCMRGDYSGAGEYADIFIGTSEIGRHNGGKDCSTQYLCETFQISQNDLQSLKCQ